MKNVITLGFQITMMMMNKTTKVEPTVFFFLDCSEFELFESIPILWDYMKSF